MTWYMARQVHIPKVGMISTENQDCKKKSTHYHFVCLVPGLEWWPPQVSQDTAVAPKLVAQRGHWRGSHVRAPRCSFLH